MLVIIVLISKQITTIESFLHIGHVPIPLHLLVIVDLAVQNVFIVILSLLAFYFPLILVLIESTNFLVLLIYFMGVVYLLNLFDAVPLVELLTDLIICLLYNLFAEISVELFTLHLVFLIVLFLISLPSVTLDHLVHFGIANCALIDF